MTAKSKFNLDCHNKLNNLDDEKTVELLWNSEHREIRDNEIADDLARFGAKQPLVDPEQLVGVSKE